MNDRPTEVFLNENLRHPENRINVALFGLLTQDWLRGWFLERLDLPTEAIVYPPTNENGVRPDFKVVGVDGTPLAWVEVELGTNPGQVADYRSRFAEPIRTVYGRRSHGGDLSLEEVADRLAEESGLPAQTKLNVQHLHDQIRQGLSGFSASSLPRAEVSAQMREHPLVAGLVERLGNKLLFTTGAIAEGHVKADTNKEQGFSLRVKSRVATNGTISVVTISGGQPVIYVPSLAKLNRYLPAHSEEVAAFAALLSDLGCDLRLYGERQRPSVPMDVALVELDRLAERVAALADRPGRL